MNIILGTPILLLLSWAAAASITKHGVVPRGTKFYLIKLSNFPSKRASLEYTIRDLNAVLPAAVKMDIYTTLDNVNVKRNCSQQHYGQLRNENLTYH